ncbi:MAG: hypothetical protein ABSE56_10320 [Bryobacteraceae bacterium]|jgi:hypothetical protein
MADLLRWFFPPVLFLLIAADQSAAGAQCGPRLSAYQGYRLHSVELRSPFSFLHILDQALAPGRAKLPAPGSVLDPAAIPATIKALEDSVRSSTALVDPPASVTAAAAFIDHCDDQKRELDLIFYLFTSRIAAPSSWSWEFGQALHEDPGAGSGIAPRKPRLAVEPKVAFDRSNLLVAGGQTSFLAPSTGFQLAVEGSASDRYTNAALRLSGSKVLEYAALWQASWAAGYHFERQPLAEERLRQGYAFGWLSAASRPLARIGSPIRYAVQFEKGYQASALSSAAFQGDARYAAVKLLAGVSGGSGPHDYSLNAGFQVGGAAGVNPAYRKLLLDGAYAVRMAFSDHRALDLDCRVTAGWLSPLGNGHAPQNERFFGGLVPRPFTDIPDWEVRASPSIRSFPNNRFYALIAGDPSGRERFVSMNLTAALTAWRLPLLPRELYTNGEFLTRIEGQKGTARATLTAYHASKEPSIDAAVAAAEKLGPVLERLQAQLESLAVPSNQEEALESCRDTLELVLDQLESSRKQRMFSPLLSPNLPRSLPRLIRDCEDELNGSLDNAEIHAAARQVVERRAEIETAVTDPAALARAESRAAEDFRIVDRALTALVQEINLVSVDPVFIFDTAYVGPAPSSRLVRYGLGGGGRLTLGSHVSFTAGYACNANRGAGEPRGAVFLEMKFHDLIR